MHDPLDAQHARGVAHHVGAVAVGVHELVRADDRAIDVALGREVQDRVVTDHGLLDGAAVGDVALHEPEPRLVLEVAQAGQVAGVRQRVEHGDLVVGRSEDVAGVIAPDESRATGDEHSHRSQGRSVC